MDDALISGPTGHLQTTGSFISTDLLHHYDAVIGFKGLLRRQHMKLISTPFIENITASTKHRTHTSKQLVSTVDAALSRGADSVAFHLNLTAPDEPRMLTALGEVGDRCAAVGMPLVVIAYPRRTDASGRDHNYRDLATTRVRQYTELVAHTVRVAVELGADVLKTYYPGTKEGFHQVVDASLGVPILVAGGPIGFTQDTIEFATETLQAGASGICFGRRVFQSSDPVALSRALRDVVNHQGDR